MSAENPPTNRALQNAQIFFAILTLGLAADALSFYDDSQMAQNGAGLAVAGCGLCIAAVRLSVITMWSRF